MSGRGTPILTGHQRSDELPICGWPGCFREVDTFPICWTHALEAHRVVQSTMSAALSAQAKRYATVQPTRPGYVYFVQFGDRIKIGFSSDPSNRIASLPHDRVLAVFPGTRLNERQLHAAFSDLRITGEWFKADDRILDFIDDVQAQTA